MCSIEGRCKMAEIEMTMIEEGPILLTCNEVNRGVLKLKLEQSVKDLRERKIIRLVVFFRKLNQTQ